jgi:membrane protein involved in colicin uptake
LFDAAVKDEADESTRELSASTHFLQTHNDLLNSENEGLRQALGLKKKHKKKSKPLDLHQRKEYHGGAVFWSPSKLREAQARERVKQQEEAEKLQKAQTRELREAHKLYKKKMAEEAKALQESAKEARAEERQKAAEEAAARRAQKEQEKRVRDSQKALQ